MSRGWVSTFRTRTRSTIAKQESPGSGATPVCGIDHIRVPRLRIFNCPPFRRTWQPRRLRSVRAQACFDVVGTASNNVAQIVRVARPFV
jgi:hypothetical protein